MIKGSDFYRIEKAIYYLLEHSEAQPSLGDLSRYLGLSEHHCHRLFKKWAGITPKDFLQFVTLAKAKKLLKQPSSVADASAEVGLSGGSRLYDLFVHHEAMTPGEFKKGAAGLELAWDYSPSPLGNVSVCVSEHGICALTFEDTERAALQNLKTRWPNAKVVRDSSLVKPFMEEIVNRMQGKSGGRMRLAVRGTAFQVKVWEALLKIPEGRVSTYQEVANLVGAPKAVRAVGTAIGANPIGVLIPCHRVIKSTGVIGEYHWGSARKAALLALEHRRSPAYITS